MSSPRTDGSNQPTSLPDEGARDPNQTRSRRPTKRGLPSP